MLHPPPPSEEDIANTPPEDPEVAAADGGGLPPERPKWSTEAPLEVETVRHLLALLSETSSRYTCMPSEAQRHGTPHSPRPMMTWQGRCG